MSVTTHVWINVLTSRRPTSQCPHTASNSPRAPAAWFVAMPSSRRPLVQHWSCQVSRSPQCRRGSRSQYDSVTIWSRHPTNLGSSAHVPFCPFSTPRRPAKHPGSRPGDGTWTGPSLKQQQCSVAASLRPITLIRLPLPLPPSAMPRAHTWV